MLRIEHQRARSGEVESGGDSRLSEASEGIRFAGVKRAQVYSWIELVLCEQEYARQGKASRGLLRRYIEKMTGMSQGTGDAADWPLYGQWQSGGQSLSPAPLCRALHDGRCRAAGLSR